jgi:hypothetical protein
MFPLTRAAVFLLLMLSMGVAAAAHPLTRQSRESREPTGTVAGRITIGGKPVPNIMVMLLSYQNRSMEQAVARGSTDEDGRFRLTRVPAGHYFVYPFAPALTPEGESMPYQTQKAVTLSDGETVEGINISLKRGGAITGRVTDANGQPVIEEQVNIMFVDENGHKQQFYSRNNFDQRTDDRGVYRIYGLPARRYVVSVGVEARQGVGRTGFYTRYYPLTYHPGVTDESKATVIELSQGGEVTDVDITVGRVEKTYIVTGRVVDADTGKPMADVVVGYGPLRLNQKFVSPMSYGFRSDAKGVLRLEGLLPGRYAAFAQSSDESGYFSDPTIFEVTDGNVSGLEVRVRSGSTINGTVVFEGATEQDLSARLSGLTLYAQAVPNQEVIVYRNSMIKVKSDGSFLMTGLAPGKVLIELPEWSRPKELSLLRIERNGVEQRQGIEVNAGEQISGVKVVLAYGTGIIRGQIKIEGMDYPEEARMHVEVRRAGQNENDGRRKEMEVDVRGHFILEGLPPGEYELIASGLILRSRTSPVHLKPVTQVVTVRNGAETELTFMLKSNERDN